MTVSASRVNGRVGGRKVCTLPDPHDMKHEAQKERGSQYPGAEPTHGVQRFRCDRKKWKRVVVGLGKEQLTVGPHQVRHDPHELHDVVHVVDQAALHATHEHTADKQGRDKRTLTCAVCHAKSSAMSTVGTENIHQVSVQP